MQPYQQRVVKEKQDLDIKIADLKDFLNSNKFDVLHPLEKARLSLQKAAMLKYSGVLADRINAFSAEVEADES